MSCRCGFRKTMGEARFTYLPKKAVYLDYNATTPVDVRVIGAYERACRDAWGNPSSLHVCGYNSWETLETARGDLGDYFGCDYRGFRFCSSGSEAVHAGVEGYLAAHPEAPLAAAETEHSAVRHPLRIRQLQGEDVTFLPVDQEGFLVIDVLSQILQKNPGTLLILSPVNHETGALQLVQKIYSLVKQYDGVLFLDGVQAAARVSPDFWVPYCDMFCISGHKIYAPKGTAALWKKEGLKIHPFRFGGGQEGGLFPGTENTPGIAACAAAVKLLKNEFMQEMERLSILSRETLEILTTGGFPFFLESPEQRAPGVMCLSFPWVRDMKKIMLALSRENICISRFSACTSRVDGPSRILLMMGREKRRAATSFRISLGRWSRRDDIFALNRVLVDLYSREA